MPFVTGFGYSAATLIEADQWIKTHADTIKIDFETDVYISSTNSMPYEDYETLTGFPLDDFISPTATEITRDDEWSGIYDNRDNYQAVRHFTYKDTEPTRCTSSGNTWWTRTACGVLPEGFMPQGFTTESSHNAFREILDHNNPELTRLEFNTLQGMITETLIDLAVTERYQYRFFNIYMGRDHQLHLGLLTFSTSIDGKPMVTCKANGCYYKSHPYVYAGDDTRDSMEQFITACIRHGNHHGPSWLTKRDDYTHMHATDCDASHWLCEDVNSPCNSNAPKVQFNTESLDASQEFLIQHRKFCRDSNCRCTHYYHLLNERTYAA
jgi:hypothetical protein